MYRAAGGLFGVLEKGLEKIPHLEKDQGVGVPGFELQVLLEHGGDFIGLGICHSGKTGEAAPWRGRGGAQPYRFNKIRGG